MNVAQLALDGAARFGEYVSIHFEGRSYTNFERLRTAERLATVLKDQGVKPGDRIVVMMPNSPDVTGAFHAIWRIGGVIVPLTPQLVAREVAYILENSGANFVITQPSHAPRIAEAIASISGQKKLLVLADSTVPGAENIAPEIAAADPLKTIYDSRDKDLALLIYTSGTTGQPKGVMQSHGNLLANTRACEPLSQMSPDTMTMHVLPLSHVFGVLCMNLGACLGGRCVILPHFDTTRAFEAIQEFKVERFSAVPTMLSYLLNYPDREKYDYSSVKLVSSGGAPLPEEVRLEFQRVFNCRIKDGYGCSEATCCISAYDDRWPHRPGSVGRPISGMELRILDDADQPLAADHEGEICVHGEHVMQGYWQNPDATALATRGGWLHTGDLGRVDADGFLYITGRKKDLIIKGGENISPRAIEEALYEHPAIAEAAVVGIPDPTFGENIAAVVALKPGQQATEAEIQAHVARYVNRFKVPARVLFRAELPKSSVGKILKRELRAELAKPGVTSCAITHS